MFGQTMVHELCSQTFWLYLRAAIFSALRDVCRTAHVLVDASTACVDDAACVLVDVTQQQFGHH